MDAFNLHWLSQQELPLWELVTFLASVVFVICIFKAVVLTEHDEAPVSFKVKALEPPSPEAILKEPAIKVPQNLSSIKRRRKLTN